MQPHNTIICLIFTLVMSSQAFAQRIISHKVTGDGCAPDAHAVAMTSDGKTIEFIYDNFVVSAGSGKISDSKTCRMELVVEKPVGQTLQPFGADLKGFVSVTGEMNPYFDLDVQVGRFSFHDMRSVVLRSPYEGPISMHRNLFGPNLAASICKLSQVTIYLNLKANVYDGTEGSDPNQQGMVAIDSAEAGFFKQSLLLNWATCK